MVTITDGSTAISTSEVNLFDETTLQHYATWIDCSIMGASDVYVIRLRVQDKLSAGTEREFLEETLTGVQDPPMFFIPYLPTDKYEVSMQKTSGTDRTFLWRRVELA